MTASTWNFGWEVMVAIIAVVIVLGFVIIILILRTPRSHRLRAGIFVERDEHEELPEGTVPDIPPPREPNEEHTAEWKWPKQD